MEPTEVVAIALTECERNLLLRAVGMWGLSARGTDELAVAMGFWGLDDFDVERRRLAAALDRGDALTRFDWARLLRVTEITFISERVNRSDWETITGLSDDETLRVLRPLQRKIEPMVGVLRGTALELPQGS